MIVSPYTRHEILESIYFRDPNGYPVEITLRLRDIEVIDAVDAKLTLEAAMQVEDELHANGDRLKDIDTVWRRKARTRRRTDFGAMKWWFYTFSTILLDQEQIRE